LQLLAVKHPRATHTRTGTASAAKKRRSKKINVAVIMGGRTAEHDISLATGTMVVNNLNRTKYNVKPVIISQRGGWHVQRGYIATSWAPGPMLRTTRASSEPGRAITRIIDDGVDVVFLALHGPYGEDGARQGMMEMLDLPYTGSDVCASAVAMDKIKTKQIYDYHRIPTPPSLVVTGRLWKKQRTKILKRIKTDIGYPCVVKPSRLGSSVGASICINEKALSKNIVVGFAYDNRLLVETFIQGREITCAVLDTPGGKPPVVLPPTEIVPRGSSYFDYHAKYTPGATDEITPAPLDKAATETIRRYALRAHEALGCHGKSRTDMIFSNGNVFVLETNTIPGLTETSLLPQAAKAHGLSFSRLLDRIITVALEAYRAKRRLKSTRDPVS
jgi:D-alanine-D-alanine ligase